VRLFLAIELAAASREALAGLLDGLAARCVGWRFVRADGAHLTLRFLGETDAKTDARCRPRWTAAVAGHAPFRIELGGLGRFPPSGAPRVLWLGVHDLPAGALTGLAVDLEAAARDAGYAAETRPFRPHLTLARAPRGPRVPAPDAPDTGALPGWRVDHVSLVRSHLGPSGARYETLERFPLAGPP